MARTTEHLEPMAKWNLLPIRCSAVIGPGTDAQFARNEKDDRDLWKINELNEANMALVNQFDEDIEEKGFPVLAKALAGVPYDNYSDMFRGTLDGMNGHDDARGACPPVLPRGSRKDEGIHKDTG
jgi:hypothetical protein